MIPARRINSREAILDAAESIVTEAGASHLTLDAAAERAGVSKGGLLYNFPTKEALLQAMVARHLEQARLEQAETEQSLPPSPGRALKASLLTAIHSRKCRGSTGFGVAMIAASANDPKLLEPIREHHRRQLAQLHDSASQGLSFERAAVVSLAMDGLMLTEMLQVSAYDSAQRQRILDDMMRLVDETVEAAKVSPCDIASLVSVSA